MSYYKITIESNSIEGLKAIQSGFLSPQASTTDSSNVENLAPPPTQKDVEKLDAFPGGVQPPPTADEAGAGLDFSNEKAFYPPPPTGVDSAIMGIGLEEEIPPPQINDLNDQGGIESQPDEDFDPTQPPGSKGPIAARKSSK